MGREVVAAITNGNLDFGPWEQIFYGEFDWAATKAGISEDNRRIAISRYETYTTLKLKATNCIRMLDRSLFLEIRGKQVYI